MIPKIENINIGDEIEIVEEPSLTYALDFETGEIKGYKDGLEAMEQVVFKILNTERYKYLIYDWGYGVELADLYGKDKAYVYSELKRRFREALMVDSRIIDVIDFKFETIEGNTVHVRFVVRTIFGDIETSREVNI